MEELGPPDTHHLSAAFGWMELGNPAEAKAELAKLSPGLAEHPDVLEVTWAIHAAAKDWTEALCTAERLIRLAPNEAASWLHFSYAMRRAASGGLEAAWHALLPAAERFPTEVTIPYNLACYACQLEQLEEARRWLQRAVALSSKARIKGMALADSDLRPLWSEIKAL
jgi:tetratricopeptide (TPR) repeat protein